MWCQVFPKRQPGWQGMQENAKVVAHYHGQEYVRIGKTQSPNLVRGLHPCQILEKLTSPTKKDMKFAGQKDQWRHDVFSHKDWEGYAPFLYHDGFSRSEDSMKIKRTSTRCFWHEQRQESSALLTRVATGSESGTEVQAVPPLEESSWLTLCNWSGSGPKIAGILPNSERESLMIRHSSVRLPHQDHQHWRWIRKVREITIKRKRSITNKGKADAIVTRRREPRGTSHKDQFPSQTRPFKEILNIAERCWKKEKPAKSAFNALGVPKEAEGANRMPDWSDKSPCAASSRRTSQKR